MSTTGPIRSNSRRSTRSVHSKPYSRPATTKKSPWAIATGLLSFLNPLRSRREPPADSSEDEDDEETHIERVAPQNLSARGRQMAHNLAMVSPAPVSKPTPHLLLDSSSPQKNLETVVSFLDQRRGQTITPLEAEGLISLIHKSTPPDKPEPFRFSSSASLPPTPARGNSPVTPTTDLFVVGPSGSSGAMNPRRTLSKNPNGIYRWSGGGSARPSKNRYTSPAFGTPSRPSSPHLVFRDSPKAEAPTKRRRLETPSPVPPAVPRSAGPAPSPTRLASVPALATPAQPPTTPVKSMTKVKSVPVVPSPLRQAWGSSPASSVSSSASSPTTSTKAASLLTAIIRDANAELPTRFADVRNPYQAASPVSRRVTNTHAPETTSRKRPRGNNANKEEDKGEKVIVPPQDIMEATMPKGSKRTRPPTNLHVPSSTSPRRSPRLGSQRDDGDTNEEQGPASKRARIPEEPPDDIPAKSSVIEAKSVSTPITASLPSPSEQSRPKPLANVPREPSKLRHSFAPPATPPPLSGIEASTMDPKDRARSLPALSLPTFSFPALTNPLHLDEHSGVRDSVRRMTKRDLPTYDFTRPLTDKGKAKAVEGFNWAAAGGAAPKLSGWRCDTCFLDNEAENLDQCAVCEAPRQHKEQKVETKGFDWAAAGSIKPNKILDGDWICGLCMLKNPSTASDKCSVCDSPR
ncbi:E3 sumo-protein ligase 2-like protein [Mycena indigotica]|uniref:E3 sumo-protein ligase 2-like protein n=1 Tax=Mycena indigotica TaxID=2126181 RepID=A0A8H6T293_9AGAR|nr:E3 sumo-protein ligase 2-like protein [Mycena indigotica]KAF7309574.1 E3 sumo-protein ligase 2-like protein [Mycena indigotica]